ncbi:cyclic lactone autoinducer peptide [Paenibacillus sp. GSMTC-2017]|uniref:cyclic lactone autoinducer peptide n=1 Tax=Paenibacillus sp. GSMTC-2017 TaxID=2794350 RepID=UPI0018D63A34|nr:cyclic lactone autoinducer peptide [Paenibacillus sp. GSMTC-2017]
MNNMRDKFVKGMKDQFTKSMSKFVIKSGEVALEKCCLGTFYEPSIPLDLLKKS